MSALREILASFDVDTSAAASKLSGIGKSLENVTSTLGALGSAFIGSAVVHGMREFIQGQIEAGSKVNDTSEKLGIGVDELQRFQLAAGMAGVGSEEAAKGLQFLSKNVGEAVGGSKGAVETFAKLGISLKDANGDVRETGDLIPEVADAFEGMKSDAERTAMAMKIFGKAGASMIPMLKGGSKGLAEMSAEYDRLGGGMSEDFVKAADAAGDEIDKLKFAIHGWKSQMAMAVLPIITRFVVKAQGWIGALRRLTRETTFAKTAMILMGVASAAALLKVYMGFAKLMGLAKGGSIWETLLGMGELGLIIIGVIALAAAIEDVYVWLDGGDSVIGDFLDSLFGIGASEEVINQIKDAFSEFWTELVAFKPVVDEFGKIFLEIWTLSLPFIKMVAKSALSDVALGLRVLVILIRDFVSELGAGLQLFGAFEDKAGDFAKSIGLNGVGDKMKSLGKSFATAGVGLSNATAKSVPASQIDGGERTQNIQHANDIVINVTEAKDAKATGEAARRGVRQGLTESDNTNTLAAVNTGS